MFLNLLSLERTRFISFSSSYIATFALSLVIPAVERRMPASLYIIASFKTRIFANHVKSNSSSLMFSSRFSSVGEFLRESNLEIVVSQHCFKYLVISEYMLAVQRLIV